MTYLGTGGLRDPFQKPRGQISTMSYTKAGLSQGDSNSAGTRLLLQAMGDMTNTTSLSDPVDLDSWETTAYNTHYWTTANGFQGTRTEIDPDTSSSQYNFSTNLSDEFITNSSTSVGASDSFTSYTSEPTRLGALANFTSGMSYSGVSSSPYSWSASQSVANYTPTGSNFFSYTGIDTQSIVNGSTWDSNFTLATGQTLVTSPVGRTSAFTQDTQGKLLSATLATFAPVKLAYDAHGRIADISESARHNKIAYGDDGFVKSITDPLENVTKLKNDAVGRVLTETLANGDEIHFTWDANGNLTSLTPPGTKAHEFTWNLFDFVALCCTPALGGTRSCLLVLLPLITTSN